MLLTMQYPFLNNENIYILIDWDFAVGMQQYL